MTYKGDLLGGALLIRENKKLAPYILNESNESELKHAIEIENILEKRSVSSAKRNATAIKKRLRSLPIQVLELLVDADYELASQICLVSVLKQNRLLGDFMYIILKEHYQLGREDIEKHTFMSFVNEQSREHPDDINFNETSLKKISQVVFLILAESGYISDTKTRKLQNVIIRPELKSLLEQENEQYVLSCMEVSR